LKNNNNMKTLSNLDSKIISMDFSSNFIAAFEVFKEDRTSDWVTILIPKSDYSKTLVQKKMGFYIQLGYSVK